MTLETEKEVDLVRKDVAKDLAEACVEDVEEMESHLCIGGTWYYDLEELHAYVQAGVELHGLPDWLVIK